MIKYSSIQVLWPLTLAEVPFENLNDNTKSSGGETAFCMANSEV